MPLWTLPFNQLSIHLSVDLGESMLATPNNTFFLHIHHDDMQVEPFRHLPRDRGEADWPVDSWIPLLALFDGWNDIGFHSILKHLPCSLLPFKNDGDWLSSNTCSSLSTSRGTPPGSLDLWVSGFPINFLTWSSSTKRKSFFLPNFLSCLQDLRFLRAGLSSPKQRSHSVTLLSLYPPSPYLIAGPHFP